MGSTWRNDFRGAQMCSPVDGVRLHEPALFRVQRPGFQQNLLRHGHLPDIVHHAAAAQSHAAARPADQGVWPAPPSSATAGRNDLPCRGLWPRCCSPACTAPFRRSPVRRYSASTGSATSPAPAAPPCAAACSGNRRRRPRFRECGRQPTAHPGDQHHGREPRFRVRFDLPADGEAAGRRHHHVQQRQVHASVRSSASVSALSAAASTR